MMLTNTSSSDTPDYSKAIFSFAALLLSGVTLAALPSVSVATAVLLIGLLLTHLILHWLCPRWADNITSWLLYAIVQSGIITTMIFMADNASLWGVAFTWLIAESVGFLSSVKPTAIVISLYTIAGIGSLLLAFGQTVAFEWLQAILPTAVFVGIIIYLYKQQVIAREQAQAFVQELETANRQITDYAARVEELTIEQERQRIARELHDTLAQGLAGLVLQLEAANEHMNNVRYDRAQTIVQNAMNKSRTTMTDARAAIDDLRAHKPIPLSHQIEKLCHQFQEKCKATCHLTIDLGVWQTQLPLAQQEQIERIVAEGLTNIEQHAQATDVTINLIAQNGSLVLKIEDNGSGFDLNKPLPPGHYGLRGIRERARILEATYQIQSQLGQGTTLLLTVPLGETNNNE